MIHTKKLTQSLQYALTPQSSLVANISSGLVFVSILLTHEGSHREVYQEFQPNYDIFRRPGAKG